MVFVSECALTKVALLTQRFASRVMQAGNTIGGATGADSSDLEGITSIPRMIEGVAVGVTMRQLESGSYKVSVRSSGNIDACKICAALGGGGHVPDVRALASALQEMMADGGAQWRRMHENLLRAGMTGGSGRIADLALKLAEEHTN
mgnify:CR=1 FL=1